MKKKILIVLGIIVVILLFTTPAPTEFKNFLEVTKQTENVFSYGRKYNFLLFSIYTRNYTETETYTHPPTIRVLKYDSLKTIRDSLRSYYQNRIIYVIKNPYSLDIDYLPYLPELNEEPHFPDNMQELTILKSGKKCDTFYIPKAVESLFLFDYCKDNPIRLRAKKINADSFMKDFEKRLHDPSKINSLCICLRNFGFNNIPESENFIDYYFHHKAIADTTFYKPQEREIEAYTNYIGILKNFIEVRNKVLIQPDDSAWKAHPSISYTSEEEKMKRDY